MQNSKTWIVLLSSDGGDVFLGELDPGIRQGVRKRDNACRFTKRGANRVAAGYSGARAIDVSAS